MRESESSRRGLVHDRLSEVALARCAEEPIHIPGLIQPHGALLLLTGIELTLVQASENIASIFGRGLDQLLGASIAPLMSARSRKMLTDYLDESASNEPKLVRLEMRVAPSAPAIWEARLHRRPEGIVVEIEPGKRLDRLSAEYREDFHVGLRNVLSRLQLTPSLSQLCELAARNVKDLTGFGRVMVYRFDAQWNGCVVAEAVDDGLDSYLHHSFPASDIPAQARAVFLENWLRMIPDVDYRPVPLVPRLNPATRLPLDLGRASLRSVSPIHLEYLRNMKVGATLTISLISRGKLWGLIACHHATKRHVSLEVRSACELVGQLVSANLPVKEELEDLDYKAELKRVHAKLLTFMEAEEDIGEALVKHSTNLLSLTASGGAAAAIYLDQKWTLIGDVPTLEQIEGLVSWLVTEHGGQEVYHSDCLPRIYPEAEKFKDIASGVLAISIPKTARNYILWFRPEVVRTAVWAGNPDKAAEFDRSDDQRLHPRKSFAAWKELVVLTSRPWKACEIEAACELRSSIMAIDLRRQFSKEQRSRRDLERLNNEKEDLVACVSHDLKNPLNAVVLNVSFIKRKLPPEFPAKLRSMLDGIQGSAQQMQALIHNLLDVAQIESGTMYLEKKEEDLVEITEHAVQLLEPIAAAKSVQLQVRRPLVCCPVMCERDRIMQVLSNLVGNAIKFTAAGGRVDVEVTARGSDVLISVKDSGVGISEEHLPRVFDRFWRANQTHRHGTGLGLAISQGIVLGHGGNIWAESVVGEGSEFFFTLPT